MGIQFDPSFQGVSWIDDYLYIIGAYEASMSRRLLYYISLLFNIRLFLYLISLKFLSQQISISRKIRIVENEHSLIKD